MRVSGTIGLEGEPAIEICGHGLRDHSWGPRYWQVDAVVPLDHRQLR